jgi:hypothetical protein
MSKLVPAALVLAALASPAVASKVRPMTLEEMTERAGRIFSGHCTGVRVVEQPGRGMPVTKVTFRVDRTLKGRPGGILTIRQPGGQGVAGERSAGILGLPRFRPGEEVILFLYGESASGLTSPVGLGQGKFTVYTDKDGLRRAVSEFGNRDLFRETSGERRGAAAERGPRGIPADALLERVRTLLHAEPGGPRGP